MRFSALAAALAASSSLGVSASPFVKRQATSVSSTSSTPSAALVVSTMSDGKETTFEVAGPTPSASLSVTTTSGTAAATSGTATPTEASKTTSAAPKKTGSNVPEHNDFPYCESADAKPFCLPSNESTLYVGNSYYVTWNPDFFPTNSTVTVKVNFANDSTQEVWSSPETDNRWGMTTITMQESWKQGYTFFNLTFYALNFEAHELESKAQPFKGPTITLSNKPPKHYEPQTASNKPDKLGVMIGVPVSLGFVLIVVFGLCIGFRKHRTIGLGSIMGRNRGYGSRKSKSERLGLGKRGAIRLNEREPGQLYRDDVGPTQSPYRERDNNPSLGSLVDDDEIRPTHGGNLFRNEVQRQNAGR